MVLEEKTCHIILDMVLQVFLTICVCKQIQVLDIVLQLLVIGLLDWPEIIFV